MSTVALLDVVRPGLDRVEAKLKELAAVEYPLLANILRDLFASGGKRLRPALVFLSAGFGAADAEALVKIATAVEMTHTATLVHDDLIDNSLLRRGNPTVNALWHGGIVVLVGDYIFAKAAEYSSDVGVVAIGRLFGQTLAVITEGELRQAFTARSWRQSEEQYFQRIYAKTASLFAASCEAGAILSGLQEADRQRLHRYGHNLGMAFQVVDDILDFVGNEQELGKPVGSDLRQGTITLPTIYFLQDHPEDADVRAVAEGALGSEDKWAAAVSAIRGSSAIERCYDTARSFITEARQSLESFADNESRRALLALADYSLERMQ